MAAKLTRMTHKIAIQLHLVAESCTICISHSRRPVRKLLIYPRTLVTQAEFESAILVFMWFKNASLDDSFNCNSKSICGCWEFFSSLPRPERLWDSPSLLSNGYQGLSLGVKRPGREADHSPPPSAEVKECVQLYFHSPNTPSWRGAQLKKQHRDTFTFTFYLNTHSHFTENAFIRKMHAFNQISIKICYSLSI
jgi:hypothetical protein